MTMRLLILLAAIGGLDACRGSPSPLTAPDSSSEGISVSGMFARGRFDGGFCEGGLHRKDYGCLLIIDNTFADTTSPSGERIVSSFGKTRCGEAADVCGAALVCACSGDGGTP